MIRIGMLLSDRYEILEKIGSGGMSDVYKAKCHKLNRLVAIKVLKQEYSTDKTFVSKFWAEAQSAACLAHPNIVNVYDVGNEQDIYYIVMELVEGITLKKYIEKKGKLEIRESIGIAMQVCQGIEAAHDQKIIHRDIKPQNIIISKDGKVKVTDFGIARAASSQTISSNAMGSVHYISPEQARGGYCDERSDIYSMGIVMYEMLTGMVPFEGESTVQVALMHIQNEIVPPRKHEPLIPVSLEKIIMKCTQKKPEARYASVAALIADLRRALMTPDEDFVKIVPVVSSNDPTRVMSADEVEQIKSEVRSAAVPTVDEEEEAYLMGYEEEEADEEYDDVDGEDEDEDDDDADPKFEKVITGISIGVAILIVILAIWIIGRAFDLFGGKSSGNETQTTTTAESTTEEDSKTVAMPMLVGLPIGDAEEMLNELGLGLYIESVAAPEEADGIVISQEFDEGERVQKHYRVKLVVSDNSSIAEVPYGLIGSNVDAVKKALRNAGLEIAPLEEVYSDEYDKDMVIALDPEEGSVLEKGTAVTITVSKGPEIVTVIVPSVTGDTEANATDKLTKASLKVEVEKMFSDEVAEGYVIKQSIASGKEVEINSTVTITVSKGASKVKVPNLLGYDLTAASQELLDMELTLSSEYLEEYSSTIEKGKIMGQSIAADTEVERGTSITVTLSKGPLTVPKLSGTADDAKKALEALGLKIKIEEQYNSAAAGQVIGQNPAEGTYVDPGTVITVYVSKGTEMVTIPSSLSGSKADIAEALNSLGLKATVTEQHDASASGTVISCNPPLGSSVAKGSEVKVVVSIGPEETSAEPPAENPASEG